MRSMAGGFRQEYLPILEDMFTTLGKKINRLKQGRLAWLSLQSVSRPHFSCKFSLFGHGCR